MVKKSKENPELLELGNKKRAGYLISSYLRAIGTEKTELVDVAVGPDKVEHRIVSKAEALARDIFTKAMEGEDEKLKLEYRKVILDRIEGKPGDNLEIEQKRGLVPDRVSEINRQRLNEMAKSGEKSEE